MTSVCARALALWLPLLVVITGVFLFAYWGIQQSYRLGANDPQVQMAEDGAAALDAGAPPASLVDRTAPLIDTTTSLAPWLAIFDAEGTPLESSAALGSDPLRLPSGVFTIATWKPGYAAYGIPLATPSGETRFSWQPRSGVREAVVLVEAHGGYFVAAGRNMREAENRIALFTKGAALLWSATALGTLAALICLIALGWL